MNPDIRLARRQPPLAPLRGHGSLRGPRQGLHHAPPGRAARSSAGPTPAWATKPPSAHLLDLGVTAVELLPVHQNVPESFLRQRGLTNYWGYNTIGFFAPHHGYSAAVRAGHPGGQVSEFQTMVDALHRAGLEVVLDVVFNHTAEAGPNGPRCASAASTTRPTTGSSPTILALLRHDRLRQLTERRRSDHACS